MDYANIQICDTKICVTTNAVITQSFVLILSASVNLILVIQYNILDYRSSSIII